MLVDRDAMRSARDPQPELSPFSEVETSKLSRSRLRWQSLSASAQSSNPKPPTGQATAALGPQLYSTCIHITVHGSGSCICRYPLPGPVCCKLYPTDSQATQHEMERLFVILKLNIKRRITERLTNKHIYLVLMVVQYYTHHTSSHQDTARLSREATAVLTVRSTAASVCWLDPNRN